PACNRVLVIEYPMAIAVRVATIVVQVVTPYSFGTQSQPQPVDDVPLVKTPGAVAQVAVVSQQQIGVGWQLKTVLTKPLKALVNQLLRGPGGDFLAQQCIVDTLKRGWAGDQLNFFRCRTH